MTDPSKTHIVALVDRTGSMQTIRSDMEGGFDAFMETQRAVELGDEVTVSLYQFDDRDPFEVVYEDRPLAEVPKLTIEPRGNTPLNDALASTIVHAGELLAVIPEDERPGRVYFVVITDGQENASREWTLERVRELVTRQSERYAWEFHFLGVGIDAFTTAGGYGISRMHTVSASRASGSIRKSYGATAQSIVSSRSQVPGVDDPDTDA